MKILVLGSGIVGTTCAYFLARDGHEVHVVDRQPKAANETSWGNAGMVSPGHAYSWASPRAPGILWRSLFRDDTALKLKPVADPRMYLWGLKFLQNCTVERARENTANKLRLCLYSQRMLQEILDADPVEFHRVTGGALFLYRDPELFKAGVANSRVLTDNGLRLETLTPEQVAEREPALAATKDRLAGAIFCPSDESGDCPMFSNGLAAICRNKYGATFHFETKIRRLVASGDRIERVETDKGDMTADAYVLALGSESPFLARGIGVDLPIYPVKGLSLTIPIAGRNGAPRLSGVDEQNLVAWSRLGDRLRLTAKAIFAGYDTSHKPPDFAHMMKVAQELFPDGGDFGKPIYWAGLRPMTPGGAPILGQGRHRNLWFNTGQGHMGWTMSFGSSRITADLIAGRKPEIDLKGLTYAG